MILPDESRMKATSAITLHFLAAGERIIYVDLLFVSDEIRLGAFRLINQRGVEVCVCIVAMQKVCLLLIFEIFLKIQNRPINK